MESALTSAAAAAICKHMNEDHAEAVAAYARTYGNVADVLAAEMSALDERAMVLTVETGVGRISARVAFDHVLADTNDARDTLIKMARAATPSP